jgi:hypothetical protein
VEVLLKAGVTARTPVRLFGRIVHPVEMAEHKETMIWLDYLKKVVLVDLSSRLMEQIPSLKQVTRSEELTVGR